MPVLGYKLMRLRKDGSLGSLFINRKARYPTGKWLKAEDHPTRGYAHRPGWHVLRAPHAPHLSKEGRVWVIVECSGVRYVDRPLSNGGWWMLANRIRIIDNSWKYV